MMMWGTRHPLRVQALLAGLSHAWRKALCAGFDRSGYGWYQIGELQARSGMVAGSPAGIATFSTAASRVLQRGVGISRMRA